MMRLIDTDDLLKVPNVRKVTEYDETGEGITYLAVPVEAIEKVPTIEAEPVRHAALIEGVWDEVYCQWGTCSKCGADNLGHARYCNECGAKLDLEG